MRPICVKCEVPMKSEHTGAIVVELFGKNAAIYRMWRGDTWRCPVCGQEIVSGFADKPFAEHFAHNCPEVLQAKKAIGSPIIYMNEPNCERYKGGDLK